MRNKLICADNLEALRTIQEESIDLIYIDPPFFSNRHYEVIWGDEAEIRSFEDRWEGGINVYIEWMKPRVEELYQVLKPIGSFYLHCDWHASHYLKIMLDEIFGKKNFQNEIIWSYRTGGATRKRFGRKHDTIFFYTKSDKWLFNTVKEKSYQSHRYGYKFPVYEIDPETGKQYSWTYPRDVWEITMGTGTGERLGYPTQKPEALLEKIIKASSNKGDIVLDGFCGCGTTLVVAQKLKREWIGIDISPTAVKVMEDRLRKVGAIKDNDYITIGMPTTIGELKKLKPFEFQNWVIHEMGARQSRKKVGDMGINGYFTEDLWHKQEGIQVKQSDGVGRNVIDNFKAALERKKYKKGYVIAFSFTKGTYEEVARLKNQQELEIKLIKIEDLLYKKTEVFK